VEDDVIHAEKNPFPPPMKGCYLAVLLYYY